jgi:hypothetical protein
MKTSNQFSLTQQPLSRKLEPQRDSSDSAELLDARSDDIHRVR